MNSVLVSICCITYNHAPFIRECLEGFLMQKGDFDYEILIHDDASTDGTQEIIREYQEKHPEIIKPILQMENQYSKGLIGRMNASFNFPRARGKYIALCEGDDCWIDPLKLQKQVEFMEHNLDCSVCFHASKTIPYNNEDIFSIKRPQNIPSDKKFEMKHAILGGGGFMATNSMVFYRQDVMHQPDWVKNAPVGDLPLMLLLASKGKIGYLDDIMSIYRSNTPGSWSVFIQKDQKRRKEHYFEILKMWDAFNSWSDRKYQYYIAKKKMANRLGYFKRRLLNIKTKYFYL